MNHPDDQTDYRTRKLAKGVCRDCPNGRDTGNTKCHDCRIRTTEAQWRKQGITNFTETDYQRLLVAQAGVCAICKRPPKTRRLAVDHDHKTGRVRGLLCPKCNRGLTWFHDNPIRLEAAANYLR